MHTTVLSANAACSPLALMSCLNTTAVFRSLLFCSFLWWDGWRSRRTIRRALKAGHPHAELGSVFWHSKALLESHHSHSVITLHYCRVILDSTVLLTECVCVFRLSLFCTAVTLNQNFDMTLFINTIIITHHQMSRTHAAYYWYSMRSFE